MNEEIWEKFGSEHTNREVYIKLTHLNMNENQNQKDNYLLRLIL